MRSNEALYEYKIRSFNEINMKILREIFTIKEICLNEAVIGGGCDCSIYSKGQIVSTNNNFILNLRVEEFFEKFHLFITNLSLEKLRVKDWEIIINALKEYGKQINVKYIKVEPTLCKTELKLYEKSGFRECFFDEYNKPLRLEIN